ncbi:hypothetical protein TNCV_2328351 [Trichonephila clavipes]|nr:hypothetical protein TNCV_2328351 [Trichonephila clavipes]
MLPVLGKKAVLEWCMKEGWIGSSYVCPKCEKRAKKALKNAASQELNISSSIITETTPKTPAERSRDYRARKRQKSEENQESNDLTRITVEVEVHQEQDNSQPSTSTLPIKRKKNFNRTCS